MSKNIKTRIQHKHDVEANWILAKGFIPLTGELIIYDADDTHEVPRIKIGDGKTSVGNLPFVNEIPISCGAADPNADTAGQFYFKYASE